MPTLAAVGLSYWTASLPIAAGISARLQASAGVDGGAGSLTSVDRDELLPAQPFVRQISVRAVSEADRGNGVRSRPWIAFEFEISCEQQDSWDRLAVAYVGRLVTASKIDFSLSGMVSEINVFRKDVAERKGMAAQSKSLQTNSVAQQYQAFYRLHTVPSFSAQS